MNCCRMDVRQIWITVIGSNPQRCSFCMAFMMKDKRSSASLKASMCWDIFLEKVRRCWLRVMWSTHDKFDDMDDGVMWCSLAFFKGQFYEGLSC